MQHVSKSPFNVSVDVDHVNSDAADQVNMNDHLRLGHEVLIYHVSDSIKEQTPLSNVENNYLL